MELKGTQWTFAASLGGLMPDSLKTQSDLVTINLLETWFAVRGGPWLKLGADLVGLQAEAGAGVIRGSRSPAVGPARSDWGTAPWIGMSARYRHVLSGSLFVEGSVGGEFLLVRHELVVEFLPDETRRVVATTPRLFADFGLSLGLQF
jgi:hypothetical protein